MNIKIVIFLIIGIVIGVFIGYRNNTYEGKDAEYWALEADICEMLNEKPIEPEKTVDEKIDECIQEASLNYFRQWDFKCEGLEREPEEGERSCALPSHISQRLNDDLDKDKEFCVERYK